MTSHATRTSTAAISVDEVTVVIDGRTLLDRVSVDLRPGELIAVVGPNGAGKSTLLNVLSGDLTTASGSVTLDDRPLRSWKLTELARRRAVLTQANAVAFPFTVREVVEMGRAPWIGTPAEDSDEEAVDSALAATEVTELQDRTFPTLSGGEKARVSLARILAQRVDTLLLDEPTAPLDLRHQEIVMEIARKCADEGGSVCVVLHDLGLAAAYSDRIVIVSGGRIRADGPPREVLTEDLVSEVYQQKVLIHHHPVTGDLIITPERRKGVS